MAGASKRSRSPYPSRSRKTKKVRFADQLAPSQITLKIVYGPPDDPSLIIVVRIGFDEHHKPTFKIDFKRGRKGKDENTSSQDKRRHD